MRCPKCHYLSFEPEPRCRNCGYDLSVPDADLSLKAFEPEGPALEDLTLRSEPIAATAPRRAAGRLALDTEFAPEPARPMPPAARAPREPRESRRAAAAMPAASITALMTEDDAEPAPRMFASSVITEPDVVPEEIQAVLRRAETRPAPPTTELPLFVKGMSAGDSRAVVDVDDELPATIAAVPAPTPEVSETQGPAASLTFGRVADELDEAEVHVPAAPAPLQVRRKAPDSGAHRPRPAAASRKLGPLDRDLLEDLQRIEKAERKEAAAQARRDARATETDRAGAGRRAAAAAIDATFLGGLAAGVLAITLRWCELPLSSIGILPIAPTAAFFLLIGGFYLLMFTAAGGQTIGKMLIGLRVIPSDENDEMGLTLGQAAYRSLVALPSVLVLGAGFVPALLGDERALHDRLAHTRVVRA